MNAIPLDGPFGAEIVGADLTGLDPAVGLKGSERETILGLLFEHGVLLLRRQPLSERQLAAFTVSFGRVETPPYPKASSRDVDGIVYVSNMADETGRLLGGLGDGEVTWHQDNFYKRNPHWVSVIQAMVTTAEGGVTQWASTRHAWATLPETLRKAVAGRRGLYPLPDSLAQRRLLARFRKGRFVRQDLEMSHPRLREACLYVSQRTVGIEGMGDEEARPLLDDLLAWVVRPDRMLSHAWQPGDLLLYDNTQVIHRRTPFQGPRLLKVTRFEVS